MINRHTLNSFKGILTIPHIALATATNYSYPLTFKIEITKIVITVALDADAELIFKNHADQEMGSLILANGDDAGEIYQGNPTSENVIDNGEYFKCITDGVPTTGQAFLALHYTTL